MLEKSIEHLCVVGVETIFGVGWKVKWQQMFIQNAGRLDLLLENPNGKKQVVEIKKGTPPDSAIDQALRYRNALAHSFSEENMECWVLAQNIPINFKSKAIERGVLCKELPASLINQIMSDFNISEVDLIGIKKMDSIVTGGGGKISKKTLIKNEIAFANLPTNMQELLRQLEFTRNYTFESGSTQTLIFYRNVKIGGINRSRKVSYIAIGLASFIKELDNLGFIEKSDQRKENNSNHSWYEISCRNTESIISAIQSASKIIDSAFQS